ncbi:hypothetical protein HH299_19015, partial [Xanthomonas sp. Kuri4-2]
MGTFSLWQLVALAVVVFGVVVPAVLAAWLIRLGSRRDDRALDLRPAAA